MCERTGITMSFYDPNIFCTGWYIFQNKTRDVKMVARPSTLTNSVVTIVVIILGFLIGKWSHMHL